jgi:lipopolysaccharide export system protein LptC
MAKLHYLTALLLIILLAFVSTWFFESIKKSPVLVQQELRHDPDYYLENFTATSMDIEGKLAYKVTAVHLEHYPDDNSMKLLQPVFSFYENEKQNWTASANEALIFQESQKIDLNGNVIMHQFPDKIKQTSLLTLTSEQLSIDVKNKFAHTKSKIKLVQGNNHIEGVGMNADLNKNKIEFMSKTKSSYVSP